MLAVLIPAASAAAETGTAAAESGCVEAPAARSAGLAMTEPMDAAVERAGAGLPSAAGLCSAAGPCAAGGSCIWKPTVSSRGNTVFDAQPGMS